MSHQWSLAHYNPRFHVYTLFDSDNEKDDETDYGNIKVDWKALTRNPAILYEEKLRHSDLPWDWEFLSKHNTPVPT